MLENIEECIDRLKNEGFATLLLIFPVCVVCCVFHI